MKILQTSVHQGDPSFVGRGRQCVNNSIMAIMNNNEKFRSFKSKENIHKNLGHTTVSAIN